MAGLSYFDGQWREGNTPIIGPMTQSFWLATTVFDGARAFEGVVPDVDRHCARVVRSAELMGLKPMLSGEEITEIALEGVARFDDKAELYIRPAYYAEDGFLLPDPDSTRFCMAVYEVPMPTGPGMRVCLSRFRRPSPDMAPTQAKASCLYPIVGHAVREAQAKGFDNAVTLDANGNVAEFASSNLFIVRDGAVHTPVPNGTFLNGITRQRVIGLLRDDGTEVVERTITYDEVGDADEIFSTGNAGKVRTVIKIDDRDLQPGPVATRAHKLYREFAHANSR